MTLTTLIRNLEEQLKNAETWTRRYDSQAALLRNKLADAVRITGKKVADTIQSDRKNSKTKHRRKKA